MLKELLNGFCDLVYPPHCLICKAHLKTFPPRGLLCQPCQASIPPNFPPFCPKCSRHLKNPQSPKCPECVKFNPKFDFAWAACLYREPLNDLICRFKYHQRTSLRAPFAKLMTGFLRDYNLDIGQFDVITPIPLFSSRLRERGFNQSQLLAEPVSRACGVPLSLRNLVRIRPTEHQTLLSEKERWTNIYGAFRINHPDEFFGKNVLMIDDLLTTGATASEASWTLKNAGAKTVGVLTLAITD